MDSKLGANILRVFIMYITFCSSRKKKKKVFCIVTGWISLLFLKREKKPNVNST